jgi:uncharacterized membrane protein YidH (DUF202 family)
VTGPADQPSEASPGDHTPPPGLQAERTTLAWARTALLCAGLALAAAHLADSGPERVLGLVVGGIVAVTGIAAAWLRMGHLASAVVPDPHVGSASPALLTASVVLADLAVLVILLS